MTHNYQSMEDEVSELAAVKRIVRERSDLFERHFAAGDARSLVEDYYVENPVMSAPDISMLRGKDSIRTLFEELMKTLASCRLKQVKVECSGDMAYEVSSAFLQPKDEAAGEIECRYMIAWRKCDDTWRVESDFFAYGALG